MIDLEIKGFVIFPGVTTNYFGQTIGEIPNGWGKAYYLDGKLYDGEWKDGKMNGRGTEYYPDGTIEYEGEYLDGYRHGHGMAYLIDGKLVYEGEWKKGERAGDKSDQTNWA